jgi:hypothetical protein
MPSVPYTSQYLPFYIMTKRLISVSVMTLSLLLAMSTIESAHAFSAGDPNGTAEDAPENFRRARGQLIRYQRNKRAIARDKNDENDYNTSTGSTSTFDRRSDVLRRAQLQRTQEDIDKRAYSNAQRTKLRYSDRESRSSSTTLRRINEAEDDGGVRQGQPMYRNYRQMRSDELERKRLLQQEYRQQSRTKQNARVKAGINNVEGCTNLTGRRYAKCLYRKQNDS